MLWYSHSNCAGVAFVSMVVGELKRGQSSSRLLSIICGSNHVELLSNHTN